MNPKPRDFGDNRFLAYVRNPELCKKRISKQMTARRTCYQLNIIVGIIFMLALIGSELGHKGVSVSLLMLLSILGVSMVRFYAADFEVKTLKAIYIIHLKERDDSNAVEQGAAANP
jgi:hypothetical protein